jgi:hypothetical protein
MAAIVFLLLSPAALLGSPEHLGGSGLPDFGVRWRWATLAAGETVEVDVADIDGNGTDDLLLPVCWFGSCWTILTKAGEGYRQLYTAPEGATVRVARFLGPGSPGLTLVGVHRVDAAFLEMSRVPPGEVETSHFPLPTEEPTDFVLGDLDSDGTLELVVIDRQNLYIHDWLTMSLEVTKYGFGGTDVALGQVDEDHPLELAIATGLGSCWVLDGSSLVVQWGSTGGFGSRVLIADVLPEAESELVTNPVLNAQEAIVRVWSPPLGSPLLEIGPFPDSRLAIAVGDANPSLGSEIVVGIPNAYPSIRLFRGSDGTEIGSVPIAGTQAVAVGELDAGAGGEIVMLADLHPTFSGSGLIVFDGQSFEPEWSNPGGWIAARGFDAADIDGDGDSELVTGGWIDPTFDGPLAGAFVFPGLDGGWSRLAELSTERRWNSKVSDLRFGQLDGDSAGELCAAFGMVEASLRCFDGPDLTHLWSRSLYPMPEVLLAADIDDGGDVELLSARGSGGSGSFVTALDAVSGNERWSTPDLGFAVAESTGVCSGEIAGRTGAHIVVVSYLLEYVTVLEAPSGAIVSSTHLDDASGTTCGDLGRDGTVEVLAVKQNGEIAMVDPVSGAWGPVVGMTGHPATLALGDLAGDEWLEVVVVAQGEVGILDVRTGTLLWTAPHQVAIDWFSGAVRALDVDSDGRQELVLLSQSSLTVLGRPFAGTTLFVDGFERGDRSEWSRSLE